MENCNDDNKCGGRREFLVKASALAGGFVLSLSGVSEAKASNDDAADVVIKVGATSPLGKVGGSTGFDTSAGPIIVIRTGEATFAAFSAKCTHKGGALEYDAASKQLACPLHGSRFNGADGSVAKGPASNPLAGYSAESAVVVAITKK